VDEAAFTKPNMMEVWERAIKPSLLDYSGRAIVGSTPNGIADDNFFHQICTDAKYGFKEYHAPTHTNPYLSAASLAKLELENHPLVFKQEYLAEFVDWSGLAFFALDTMLVDGQPVQMPVHCDVVFAVIDSAFKTGDKNDGTAVSFWARSKFVGHPLILLDYDIVQIEGDLLERWLPVVLARVDELAKQCGTRMGSLGAFIEDKASGIILLQQAKRRGWNARAIDNKLTDLGKDSRAIGVSGYVYQGKIKISEYAFNKTVTYKGRTQNHFITQVCGYRIGVKDQADDLTDTFMYAISIALGDGQGY
jgi:phage terminase large subunit-like protein